MVNQNSLLISERDYQDLTMMLNGLSVSEFRKALRLEEELLRATIIPLDAMPSDVVTMNSVVGFIDTNDGEFSKARVVYPGEANIHEGKVSVLAPIGSALLGLRVGQEISWPLPSGRTKTLKVVEVVNERKKAA